MSFDVSASKQVLAFGDSDGCIHLWADTPEATFNTYPRDTEFALPCMVDNLPHLDWNQDLLPLSLIPVPLSNETLLSDWPAANSTPAPRYISAFTCHSSFNLKRSSNLSNIDKRMINPYWGCSSTSYLFITSLFCHVHFLVPHM